MQVAERRGQSWRIHITSKARSFNFRFKFKFTSTRFTPNRTLSSFRLSIVLKLRKFILKINSNPTFSPKINSQPSTTKPKNARGFFKAIVMIIVRKFRARLAKIAAKPESHAVYPKVQQIKLQNTIHIIGLWVAGFLASLSQIVLSNGQKGVIMVASMLFKKFNPVKLIVKLATLALLVAPIACYLFHFNLDDNNYYWDYIAWSWSSLLSKIENL